MKPVVVVKLPCVAVEPPVWVKVPAVIPVWLAREPLVWLMVVAVMPPIFEAAAMAGVA